ncbi:beta-lactamase class C and other penicillin binding protein [Microthyrium microscopicum]|uniref:Beta-lactamase class C and other penicillin binding protein n=1 Tax=Microthyrium microscopicum TaxID=703497 RepID=A0A6A6UNX0_9PEZI|nr:beta-lactamase class C and other penicillin binding protein [Microthyrium microscopicum]
MASFDETLRAATDSRKPVAYGIVCRGVDRRRNVFYQKQSGHRTSNPTSEAVAGSHFFKIASATKLITAIALLQCVDRGLIDLDEPISRVVPELGKLPIISYKDNNPATNEFVFEKPTTPVTLRHLLTHTNGNPYDAGSPILMAWRKSRNEKSTSWSTSVSEAYQLPLIFNPGDGWTPGGGLEWGGVALSRLNGDISCEEYMIENIFKPIGSANRTTRGGLEPTTVPSGENVKSEMGGSGLVMSPDQYIAVLADIVSEDPRLLSEESVEALFRPQFWPGSNPLQALCSPEGRRSYEVWSGVQESDNVNHTLGGLFIPGRQAKFNGQPESMLMWHGAMNCSWFASRKSGVAAVIFCQVAPPIDAKFMELFNEFKKDFWTEWISHRFWNAVF